MPVRLIQAYRDKIISFDIGHNILSPDITSNKPKHVNIVD